MSISFLIICYLKLCGFYCDFMIMFLFFLCKVGYLLSYLCDVFILNFDSYVNVDNFDLCVIFSNYIVYLKVF